jgi:hypothetical protein
LALIFPQLWHTVSKSFLILVTKPKGSQRAEREEINQVQQTNVKYWRRKLDMTEMSRAFLGTFFTSLAVVLTVDCAEARVVDTLGPRPLTLFILSCH